MASFEVDPMIAAGIVLDPFLSHKKPFSDSDWRAPGIQIPSQHEMLIRVSVVGYQLFTYLKLIEEKFGPEISRIVREYQIIALNRVAAQSHGDLPEQWGDQTCELLHMIQRAHDSAGT